MVQSVKSSPGRFLCDKPWNKVALGDIYDDDDAAKKRAAESHGLGDEDDYDSSFHV